MPQMSPCYWSLIHLIISSLLISLTSLQLKEMKISLNTPMVLKELLLWEW